VNGRVNGRVFLGSGLHGGDGIRTSTTDGSKKIEISKKSIFVECE
jgi:hypothetical protein